MTMLLYAKKILTAFPLEQWKRSPGRAQTTWIKPVLDDLKSHYYSGSSWLYDWYYGSSHK